MINHKQLKFLFITIFMSIVTFGMSQATFILHSIPDYTPTEDPIYIAGNFNNWNPGDADFALQKNDEGQWFILMPEMNNGSILEFKFTRGDWSTVEKGADGEEIANRIFVDGNGTTQEYDILN